MKWKIIAVALTGMLLLAVAYTASIFGGINERAFQLSGMAHSHLTVYLIAKAEGSEELQEQCAFWLDASVAHAVYYLDHPLLRSSVKTDLEQIVNTVLDERYPQILERYQMEINGDEGHPDDFLEMVEEYREMGERISSYQANRTSEPSNKPEGGNGE